MKAKTLLRYVAGLALAINTAQAQTGPVHIAGAMSNVMWKGELSGTIDIDTISNKSTLFGLGPLENLAGELLIVEGKIYQSTVLNKEEMKVAETQHAKAPFFVYANQSDWDEIDLPASVKNLQDLENFINKKTKNTNTPFVFRLEGMIDMAIIHIVNLPPGTKVSSPGDAHQGKTSYTLIKETSTIVGFFSRKHQGI
ncbi:MAG TPA: acetolactate decarboxylase, partial [Prolixibacteraceae bacterium]|nr:acetolactate decarboxylase [Prolixibacteraceae bacterium]